MLIEISGLQRVGKSTLIDSIDEDEIAYPCTVKYYKFPMGKTCKDLKITPTWEMQIAKDVAMLEYDKLITPDSVVIADRGPLSTIYYSLLFERASIHKINEYIRYLKENYTNWKPIWVMATNQPVMTREKNDGFDKLQSDLDPEHVSNTNSLFCTLLNGNYIDYKIFVNDFSDSLDNNIEKFNNTLKEMLI